jgi:hypothetical protein
VQIGTAAYDVYCAQPGPFGNPFHIGIHGTRAEVIAMYNTWIRGQPKLMARLPELKGKVLGCWCREGQRCHCDCLLALLKEQGIEP